MESEIGSGTRWLREHSAEWDDLWDRSGETLPTARAEPLALFAETFGAGREFYTIAVRRAGQWLAAVPLIAEHRGGWLRCLKLPHNEWFTGGAAMLDRRVASDPVDVQPLVESLVRGLDQLDWRAVICDGLTDHSSLWQALSRAMQHRGWFASWEERQAVAWLPISRFESTLSHLSKSTRKKLRRAERTWRSRGGAGLRVFTPCSAEGVERWVGEAIDIEHYKSLRADRTSIRAAGLEPFFLGQAALVAEHGEFLLAMLEAEGRPVAFEYGWLAKGTYHALKVGYLPRAGRYMPGHLLIWKLGEHLRRRGDVERIDCLCDASNSLARTWRTEAYRTYRLWACKPAWFGRTLAWGLKQRRLLSSYREPAVEAATPCPG